MNFSFWLSLDKDLLLTAEHEEEMKALIAEAVRPEFKIGVPDNRFPLLANLNVLENIALKSMYHKNSTLQEVHNYISPLASILMIDDLLQKRKEQLAEEDLFNIYLLRCIANQDNVILLVEPEPTDWVSTYNFVKGARPEIRLWACCYADESGKYDRLNLRNIKIGD